MNKKDIKRGEILYWNTTGAYGREISLKCQVIDIGKWVWVKVFGNLAYNNLLASNLSKEPFHKVTNNNIRLE